MQLPRLCTSPCSTSLPRASQPSTLSLTPRPLNKQQASSPLPLEVCQSAAATAVLPSAALLGTGTAQEAAKKAYDPQLPIAATAVTPATPSVSSASALSSAVTTVEPSVSSPSESRVQELTPETYQTFLQDAGSQFVVVEYYTDWCGPCKLMHAELDKVSRAFTKIQFGKVNVGKHEQFGTLQRVRALPCFRIFKEGKCVHEMTGARPVQIRQTLLHYSWGRV